jgi:hypothetical protein
MIVCDRDSAEKRLLPTASSEFSLCVAIAFCGI